MRRNKRRICIVVTAQTAHNLRKLAAIGGLRDEGAVVDKLTRDRMVQMHHPRNEQQEVKPIGFRI